MAVLWNAPDATVRGVLERLTGRHPAYTTVMTVMNRLVGKGLLRRTRDGAGFRYAPTAGRADQAAIAARDSVAALMRDFGPSAVAGFADALDAVDPALLRELRRRR